MPAKRNRLPMVNAAASGVLVWVNCVGRMGNRGNWDIDLPARGTGRHKGRLPPFNFLVDIFGQSISIDLYAHMKFGGCNKIHATLSIETDNWQMATGQTTNDSWDRSLCVPGRKIFSGGPQKGINGKHVASECRWQPGECHINCTS